MSVLALWLALYGALAVHLGTVALVGGVLGARVEEVRLATGGAWVVRAAAPRVSVGVLPGGYVRFVGGGDRSVLDGYEALAAWRRAVIPVCGPLAVLGVAVVLLGPQEALASAARAPLQLLAGLRPFGGAPDVLSAPDVLAAAAATLEGPALTIVGVACAKVAAFNLLPLPPLALGQALLAVVPLPERLGMRVTAAGAVVSALLFVAWAIALVAWLVP